MSFLDLSDLGLQTSAGDLQDEAIGSLQDSIDGYEPNPGNLEVIQIEAVSLEAADTVQTALVVPSAIWRNFGSKLQGVPYLAGTRAQTQVTFTLSDTLGHTIDAGTDLTINDLGFFTQGDLTINNGSNTGTVTAVAVAAGVAYNGVASPAALVNNIDWVTNVTTTGASYGGVDPEDDPAYGNRLVGELRLQAPRPITADDYQLMAISFPPALGTDQQQVGRAVAIDGYNPAPGTISANTATGNTTLSSVSSFAEITVGTRLSGTGITTGTTVTAVNIGASSLTMSNPATATTTGDSITVTGTYGNARMVGLWLTDANGLVLNSDTLTAVAAWFESYREVNFIVNTMSPTYTTVYVSASLRLYPGWDPASTAANVQAAIVNVLNPPTWGQTSPGRPWYNDPVVRYDKLIGVIQQVAGVDYVPVGGLKIGLTASPTATTDVVLPGAVALPLSTTTSVPLPTIV